MKSFEIPPFYRSDLISLIKAKRKAADKLKKDFSPSLLDYGNVKFYLARHFGFCFGVENAIEIAFKTLEENPGKRIFLLSEMIHNPQVNDDLRKNGVQFIMDTLGNHYIEWNEINNNDIVIIPAFGTTIHTMEILKSKGIDPLRYNTTCPFVEKVWKRGDQIGKNGFTIIIHGKAKHEETRATFSQCAEVAPSLIIENFSEAEILAKYIRNQLPFSDFDSHFAGRYSQDFKPERDLQKIGVINQTTMLAEDTQAIADYLKYEILQQYPLENSKNIFADTRDTLCYATNDNQSAVKAMLEVSADLAIVVGGYNSSNTSHLVELCENVLPTFYIKDAKEIISKDKIQHYDFHNKTIKITDNFLPEKIEIKILITAGASCPDALVEQVLSRIASFYNLESQKEHLLESLKI